MCLLVTQTARGTTQHLLFPVAEGRSYCCSVWPAAHATAGTNRIETQQPLLPLHSAARPASRGETGRTKQASPENPPRHTERNVTCHPFPSLSPLPRPPDTLPLVPGKQQCVSKNKLHMQTPPIFTLAARGSRGNSSPGRNSNSMKDASEAVHRARDILKGEVCTYISYIHTKYIHTYIHMRSFDR